MMIAALMAMQLVHDDGCPLHLFWFATIAGFTLSAARDTWNHIALSVATASCDHVHSFSDCDAKQLQRRQCVPALDALHSMAPAMHNSFVCAAHAAASAFPLSQSFVTYESKPACKHASSLPASLHPVLTACTHVMLH